MELPIFIAKIVAVIYLCVGFGGLINKKHFNKVMEEYNKYPGLEYLGGLIALMIGCLMIGFYNVWSWNWTILVTLLGWVAFLKGASYILFPETVSKFTERMLKSKFMAMIPLICIIFGLIFGYFGFIA